jgi:acyl dehydratase
MSTNEFAVPVSQRFFEDYVPGLTSHSEVAVISETAILQFAREFDPQPIHTDEAAANAGVFGGLIASGWHSAAITMRLMLGCYLNANASLASPGVDELRWRQPVRPGDELTATLRFSKHAPPTQNPIAA